MFRFKDKRTNVAKQENSFIARVEPKVIAKLMKDYVFPKVRVPNLTFITLTDNGYVAKKVFVGGVTDYHTAVVKFTDFETTGDFAEVISPVIEAYKKSAFGAEYENASKNKQNTQER